MATSVAAGADTVGNYYRGVVCNLHRGPERGRVRTASGREIPFIFLHVTMPGERRRFTDLREGLVVGYDVGWTSKGLRVSVIRVLDDDFDLRLERQLGPEEGEPSDHFTDEDSKDRDVE